MSNTHHIQLLPHGRQITAKSGRSLMETLVDHSIFLRSDCGGRGSCGKCKVNRVTLNGSSESVTSCTLEVTEDLKIEIPE
ncbi:MAG: 2Fe-2S iron-sulfur cluster binding domain-containing protein, partial [Deltaproteobacteria bacterium]|nr:2Fe-2S iron-sulfur cluster binding domain-containing protein [Deltaproteobacteria bacterium]